MLNPQISISLALQDPRLWPRQDWPHRLDGPSTVPGCPLRLPELRAGPDTQGSWGSTEAAIAGALCSRVC
jgi:hypothetical protein